MNIGEPLIVIPDIQAHHQHLETLVEFFRRRGYLEGRKVVFLGDIPDRGYDTRKTMDLICALVDEGSVCLKGNHDFVLESALGLVPLDFSIRSIWIKRWATRYESGTLRSYGIARPSDNATPEEWLRVAEELREAMPERHTRLLHEMPWFAETDRLILVHAGLLPDVSWQEQRAALLEKKRNDPDGPAQIFSHDLAGELATESLLWPKRIVSGHALVSKPVFTSRRILLNCGVELGGPLVGWVSDTNEVFEVAQFNPKKVRRYKDL